MQQILLIDEDKCTGCSVCELFCSMEKTGEYNPGKSFIKILRHRELDFHVIALDIKCDVCQICVDCCPTGALRFVSHSEAALARKEQNIHPALLLSHDFR